jgi:Domain of unknown function (DUF3291)
MLVSITRLRVRQWRFLPSFLFHALKTRRQVERSAGFLGGAFARELPLVFWTITVWTDERAMRSFRNTGVHMRAMPRLMRWCDEASYVHWQQDNASTPTSAVAFTRLREAGKTSKVSRPSAAHAAGRTTADREPKVVGGPFLPRRV